MRLELDSERAFAVFEINVRNEASYIEAYKKFTDASVANGLLTGAFGIERVVAGRIYALCIHWCREHG